MSSLVFIKFTRVLTDPRMCLSLLCGFCISFLTACDEGGGSSGGQGSSFLSDDSDSSGSDAVVSRVSVGEPATINGIEWTISEAQLVSGFKDQWDDLITPVDESTILLLLKGKVVNRNKKIDTELGDFVLVDAEGAEYAEHESSEGLFLDQLSRNVPKPFSLVFELPKSASTPVSLRISDASLFEDSFVFIDVVE